MEPSLWNIRCALPHEHETLSQIALAAKRHWDYPSHWMELWTPQLTFNPAYFQENESWVLEQNGALAAFYTLQERTGVAWIENMWALPERIGQGVGKQLFLHAIGLARERRYKSLQLEAEPNAVGFYEKMGMRQIGDHQYELDGQPRLLPLMEITL